MARNHLFLGRIGYGGDGETVWRRFAGKVQAVTRPIQRGAKMNDEGRQREVSETMVTEGGVPTLRSSNVRHLWLDIDYVKPISRHIANQYRRTFLEGGEVLVTVRGTLGPGVDGLPGVGAGRRFQRREASARTDHQDGQRPGAARAGDGRPEEREIAFPN